MKTFLSVKQLAFSDVVRTLLAYLYPHQWWDKVPTYFTFNSISNSLETDNRYVQLTKRRNRNVYIFFCCWPFFFQKPSLWNFEYLVQLVQNTSTTTWKHWMMRWKVRSSAYSLTTSVPLWTYSHSREMSTWGNVLLDFWFYLGAKCCCWGTTRMAPGTFFPSYIWYG